MSLQDSTFRTAHVLDNEIIKANDFEFAFEQLVTNVSKATQMLMESNQDFVINGRVLVDTGMNVRVSPIYGVCKSTGLPFGRTEETDETIGFEGSSSGRVDILEVKGDWETYDEQQRAFNDPDIDTQTYQYIDTKKLMKPVYQVKKGVEGSNVAPEVDTGYVKLAEVVIRAGISQLSQNDIKNITADVAGENNEDWTTQPAITYNIGYISDVNARFREQHNADGTHKDDVIDIHSLNIGTGENQVNGNILPVGGSVTLPTGTIIGSESIKSAITAVAAVVTTIYNTYLKYGSYGFKGTLAVSSIADANNNLTKPITITAVGDGTAVIKIDGAAVLSIDSTGKLSTNGYTATASNHIVTKAVTDAISNSLSALAIRVTNLENELADNYKYINKTLSRDRYDYTGIQEAFYATTENITLSGSQIIDGATPNNGDLILVKDQTNKKENGLYSYSNNSAWTRYTPFSTPSSYLHKLFVVSYGTINNKKIFLFPNEKLNNPTTFGYDDFEFNEYIGTFGVSSNANANINKFVMRDSDGRIIIRNKDKSITDYAATRTEIDNLSTATTNNINALYGNVVGTALGNAAVGTATTFARSDHVHPMPSAADVGVNTTAFPGLYCTGTVTGNRLASVYDGAYWGIADPNGVDSTWIRTTSSGLIPYQQGAYDNGHQYLGTESWYFAHSYISQMDVGGYNHGCITHINSAFLHIYTDAPQIAFNKQTYHIGGICTDTAGSIFNGPIYYNSSNCFGGNAYFCGAIFINSGVTDYPEPGGNYILSMDAYAIGGRVHYALAESQAVGKLWLGAYPNEAYQTLKYDSARFWWSGQCGQPTWVWGGNDASNMYVYNPSNFNVNYANSAGSAGSANIANKAYNIPVCSGGQHVNWGSIWICC